MGQIAQFMLAPGLGLQPHLEKSHRSLKIFPSDAFWEQKCQKSQDPSPFHETPIAIVASKMPAVFCVEIAPINQLLDIIDNTGYGGMFFGQKKLGMAVEFAIGFLPARFAQRTLNN